ncbi:unnamed protein product [Vicia faba]|uniref:Uncharacterized protein n=1 Tax=Vicia faba TaxID=3906 RepID=A0AAV0YAH1_VICFA|nr:unnamed protein product [Vicia faba]
MAGWKKPTWPEDEDHCGKAVCGGAGLLEEAEGFLVLKLTAIWWSSDPCGSLVLTAVRFQRRLKRAWGYYTKPQHPFPHNIDSLRMGCFRYDVRMCNTLKIFASPGVQRRLHVVWIKGTSVRPLSCAIPKSVSRRNSRSPLLPSLPLFFGLTFL